MMADKEAYIREAIVDLLADGGYHHASLRRLAERAGVTPTAVYTYADSKEDLVFGVIDELLNGLLEETNLVLESLSDPHDRLRAFTYRLAYWTASCHRESRILQHELRELSPERRAHIVAVRDRYEGILRKILADSNPTADADSPIVKDVTRAILGMCTSISDWYRPDKGPMTPDEIGAFYADLVAKMTSALEGHDSTAIHPEPIP